MIQPKILSDEITGDQLTYDVEGLTLGIAHFICGSGLDGCRSRPNWVKESTHPNLTSCTCAICGKKIVIKMEPPEFPTF